MSQASSDTGPSGAAGTAVGRSAQAVRAPPMSPHLQVWRWHVTMAASIATRTAGIVLFLGALIAAGVLAALAGGPGGYATALAVTGSIPGKLVLFGVTTALFYYLASGVRHFAWDSGHGFQPRTADLTGLACFGFGLLAAVAVWAVAFLTGAA